MIETSSLATGLRFALPRESLDHVIGYNPLLPTLIKSSGPKTVGLVSPYANPTPNP